MPEYREGDEAKERFEQAMRTAFQAPKPAKSAKKNPGKEEVTSLRKPPKPDKD